MSLIEIKRTLEVMVMQGDVVELRIFDQNDKKFCGWFTDMDRMAEAALSHDAAAEGTYYTCNACVPDMIGIANNRIVPCKTASSEKNMLRRRIIGIDIDPRRNPVKISSTDEEHNLSIEKAREIRDWLKAQGWSDPVLGDSGNGAHLDYFVDLPVSEDIKMLYKRLFEFLKSKFSNDKIDVQGFEDANRVWKLYGTMVRKGENLPNRPHRKSKILEMPENKILITLEQIKAIADNVPEDIKEQNKITPQPQSNNKGNAWTPEILKAWLDKYNIEIARTKTDSDKTYFILKACLFNPDHAGSKEAEVHIDPNGVIGYKCHHNSCKDVSWVMVREKLDPQYKERKEKYAESKKCINCRHYPGETGNCTIAKRLMLDDFDAGKCQHFKQAKQNICGGNGDSQASVLIKYVESPEVELFHDDTHNPYARIKIDGHDITLSIKERGFKRYITHQHYKDTGKAVGTDALHSALNVIEAKACFDGKEYKLHNRLCQHDGAIFFDLGNWEAVKINSQGWDIIKNPPILFVMHKHQKGIVQSHLSQKGDVMKVLEFINIKDKKERLLFVVYLISCFIPDIPHIILTVHGDKGAAKSTLFKIVKELVDPSIQKILTFPKDNTELIQILSHHHYAAFDNVSRLSDWQSDALCRACTGEGFSKRELYTNDEDVIYSYQRCIGLNGINVVATKPDLLDRSILLMLERLPKDKRKPEVQLWQAFDKVKGEILSGIFITLSKTMAIYPTIKLDELPRMADFTVWGCAIAEALGYGKDAFLEAYNSNIQAQNREAIEGSPVGELILKFMEDKQEWKGRPSELLIELESLAEAMKVNIKAKTFPKAAHVLTKRLNEIKTNLLDEGITFESKHDGHQRILTLEYSGNSVSSVKALESQSIEGKNTNATEKSKRYDSVNEALVHEVNNATALNTNATEKQGSVSKNQDAENTHNATNGNNATFRTFLGEGELSQLDKMRHVRSLLYDGMSKEGIEFTTGQVKADLGISKDEAVEYVKRAIVDRDRGA